MTKDDPVHITDTGLIALALMVYHEQVLEHNGSQELADRSYELYLKYRDMKEEDNG
jgi:hypothetical protein